MFDCLLRLAYRSVHLSVYLIGLPVLCGQKVRTSEPTYLCYFRRSSPVLCTKQKCVCVCVCVYLCVNSCRGRRKITFRRATCMGQRGRLSCRITGPTASGSKAAVYRPRQLYVRVAP